MTLPLFEHTIFINLESREDRRTEVIQELQNWGIPNPIRFNAIKMPDGAIGCTMSHIKCLELAKERDYPQVFICEDDIHCVDIPRFHTQIEEFCKEDIHWDVLIVAGNNIPYYRTINDGLLQVWNCWCATGYIVKRHYYDKIIANFREGLKKLMLNPSERHNYALDMYWRHLQCADSWLMMTPATMCQRPSYSDIEKHDVDYSAHMLNNQKY
jgi:GR25 family glycosyltransferase involved in LPS biosynthesis